MGEVAVKSEGAKKSKYVKSIILVVCILVALIIVNNIVGGKLLTLGNFRVLIQSTTPPALVAWGFCIIFTGNITDLSPGAIVILASSVAGIMGAKYGLAAMLLFGILSGMACMLVNFTIYRVTKVPPWIAGLGMTMVYEAIIGYYGAWCTKHGQKVVTLTGVQRTFGTEPVIYIMLIIGFVIAYIFYNHSSLGINFRAVGNNEDVSKILGVKIDSTLILGGIAAGFFFGYAGAVKEAYAGFVEPVSGLASLSTVFQPMAAVLLAMAMSNMINIIIGVPISCFLIMLIFNVLTLLGVPSGTFQETLLGVIVILFAILSSRNTKGVVK